MQEKHLYEYAILRVVPKVEREEFINVGVLLCCKKENFLCCKVQLDKSKLHALDPEADFSILSDYIKSLELICEGKNELSPISLQDSASRFRWLTAPRSSMLQTSRPHGGLSADLESTLEDLFNTYVK
ncbi:DUF3037 domain-containing protein [Cecembia rubra]|uniref:DUF3037 family protein n=1 Tax=Cecembia rubra TaxID=1485585 RepID=A0A2P8E5Z5_9BACT|nr:DUF3037 domain-containing protein [Cecembia rubra]PSL04905.1 Protein of unknown function (DUF3037) [Cecembia rubra]